MRTILFVGAVLAALAGHARADTPTEAVMLKYLDWITANSAFEYNGESLPRLVETSTETLVNLTGGVLPVAAYTARPPTIYLAENLPAAERAPTLIHELVHYLQDLRGDFAAEPCVWALEPAAYEIEEAWMVAHEHPGPRPDWFTIRINEMHCYNPHQ